jgi:hypothetical protein
MNRRFFRSLNRDVSVTRYLRSCGVTASLIIGLVYGIAALLIAPAQVVADEGHDAFFAEPSSGRKVTHYSVELAVARDERRSFMIPDDCDAVVRALEEGTAYRGRIIDRRLWHKVEGDCRFHDFLYRHPRQALQDYVSDYDFMNARLSDLPIDRRCARDAADAGGTVCDPMATDASGLLRHFPLAQSLPDGDVGDECECELTDGIFRGHLFVDEQGMRCTTGPDAPSLRLIAVDFADINGDRFLDAVLRFVPLRARPARMPLILPLTRFEPGAPFSVPELQRPAPPVRPSPPEGRW